MKRGIKLIHGVPHPGCDRDVKVQHVELAFFAKALAPVYKRSSCIRRGSVGV